MGSDLAVLDAPPIATETVRGSAPAGPRSGRALAGLFGASSFVASGLMFAIEPMVAKLMLPLLGGSPAVWNTALGVLPARPPARVSRRPPAGEIHAEPPRRVAVAIAALPLLVLPVAMPDGWTPPQAASPVWWTFLLLIVSVGAPFFALSTVSPTLQRWYGLATDRDPYVLYATGNTGSLVALLAYPLLIEPRFDLPTQTRVWAVAYIAFVGLLASCAVVARRRAETASAAHVAPPSASWSERLRWCAIAAIPSALLLGVTRHIATDIASVPLLWVVPLALYLATFIVAFSKTGVRLVDSSALVARVLVIPVVLSLAGTSLGMGLSLSLHLSAFFAAALLAHARLVAARPEPAQLTQFYVWMSTGGVLGGIASAILAPVLFDQIAEYPMALAATMLLLPAGKTVPHRRAVATVVAVVAVCGAALIVANAKAEPTVTLAVFGVGTMIAYSAASNPRLYAACIGLVVVGILSRESTLALSTERTFFGVYRVTEEAEGRHVLHSGTTAHGVQGPTNEPLGYYADTEGIGHLFESLDDSAPSRRVAIIGLGAGALASYGRAADEFDFYEIDRAVVDIARDPALFTYLEDSPAEIRTIVGDGRIMIEDTTTSYDIVVLDAFSSDAIPVHLLTQEALATYVQRLRPGGVVAMHISNRYFDFVPVVGRLATDAGLDAQLFETATSTWMVLGADAVLPGWESANTDHGRVWTDDYSDLLGALR